MLLLLFFSVRSKFVSERSIQPQFSLCGKRKCIPQAKTEVNNNHTTTTTTNNNYCYYSKRTQVNNNHTTTITTTTTATTTTTTTTTTGHLARLACSTLSAYKFFYSLVYIFQRQRCEYAQARQSSDLQCCRCDSNVTAACPLASRERLSRLGFLGRWRVGSV